MRERIGWGVAPFQAPGDPDRYHVLPEQFITGGGGAARALPWVVGAVALFILVKGVPRVR